MWGLNVPALGKGVCDEFLLSIICSSDRAAGRIYSCGSDVSNGLPVFHMVGYLSSEVKEAAERVRTAIRNSGVSFPAKRTIVNLRRQM